MNRWSYAGVVLGRRDGDLDGEDIDVPDRDRLDGRGQRPDRGEGRGRHQSADELPSGAEGTRSSLLPGGSISPADSVLLRVQRARRGCPTAVEGILAGKPRALKMGATYRLTADLGRGGRWAVDSRSQSGNPRTTQTGSTPGPPANTTTCSSTGPMRR